MGRRERKLSGDKDVVKRGAWSPKEDKVLADYIETHGEGKWSQVAKKTGLNRGGKSCRLRWLNYLRPDIKRGNISPDEEDLIIRMHKLLGNRWCLIAGRLPGRTDSEIKNFWNIHLKKRVSETGRRRMKINAENDGANEGGPLHHLHHVDQRVNIEDDATSPCSVGKDHDIWSGSFLRDLDNFINDLLNEAEIDGHQDCVVDDHEGEY